MAATDRSVRFLHALGRSSTSRVLNLVQIAKQHRDNPEYSARPMFRSPVINASFVLKHRMRTDETYLFSTPRTVATKIIVPFDPNDLRAGGRSVFVDQRGFAESLRSVGSYNPEQLERDLGVMRLLNSIPSLDPFLLREHLRNHNIDVAPCYFNISTGDQERMHAYVSDHLQQLIVLATGAASSEPSTNRMVAALLSNKTDDKLEPLRQTLGLTPKDFREGVFSWRGFLYYKWSISNFWPDVMHILREIKQIQPQGILDTETRAYLTQAKRNLIEMVRDNGNDVTKVLQIYDDSYSELVAHRAPKMFRDFLLSAPYMFVELGEKMGAISHIVSFWRYRFPSNAPKLIDAEELAAIFHDFTCGFTDHAKDERGAHKAKPRKPAALRAL